MEKLGPNHMDKDWTVLGYKYLFEEKSDNKGLQLAYCM